MKKLKLSQAEIDKLVTVERRIVKATVEGVGVVDVCFQISIKRQVVWQYQMWHSMIRRGCSSKKKMQCQTYKDVTVCAEWLSFGNFLEWVNKEVGYKGKPDGMSLDKDIILRGNRIYSPETCSFVPQSINMVVISGESGFTLHKPSGKYTASYSCNGKHTYIGFYATQDEAFQAYKTAKESRVKSMALQYKDVLRPDVFDALMAWQVDIFS